MDSGLSEDRLPALEGLTRLEEIELCNAYLGRELCFPSESFQKLKKLKLRDLPDLEVLLVKKGALPRIGEMNIQSSKKVKVRHCHEGEGEGEGEDQGEATQ